MPMTAHHLKDAFAALYESDRQQGGFWQPCLQAVEEYLVQVEAIQAGLHLPVDLLRWIEDHAPSADAMRFALWALQVGGAESRLPLPAVGVPEPRDLWGWVTLFHAYPAWRPLFQRLPTQDARWRPVLSNWHALERLATQWHEATSEFQRERYLDEALLLMGRRPAVTAGSAASVLPAPPLAQGGVRMPILPRAGKSEAVAPVVEAQIGALVARLEHAVSDVVGRAIGALDERFAQQQADLHDRLEARLEAGLQANHDVAMRTVDAALRGAGVHPVAMGDRFMAT